MNKPQLQEKCDEAGIEYSEENTKPELQALLDSLDEDVNEEDLTFLKLKKRHPRKSFRLGRHKVGLKFEGFELNEEELKELDSKGCKHWIEAK